MDYLGIDGSKKGWVIAIINSKTLTLFWIECLTELKLNKNDSILIDMPITLPTTITHYPRQSDILAKKYLGRRHSCIFYAPVLFWLSQSYECINVYCETHQKPKLSKQSFYLIPKITETLRFKKLHDYIYS